MANQDRIVSQQLKKYVTPELTEKLGELDLTDSADRDLAREMIAKHIEQSKAKEQAARAVSRAPEAVEETVPVAGSSFVKKTDRQLAAEREDSGPVDPNTPARPGFEKRGVKYKGDEFDRTKFITRTKEDGTIVNVPVGQRYEYKYSGGIDQRSRIDLSNIDTANNGRRFATAQDPAQAAENMVATAVGPLRQVNGVPTRTVVHPLFEGTAPDKLASRNVVSMPFTESKDGALVPTRTPLTGTENKWGEGHFAKLHDWADRIDRHSEVMENDPEKQTPKHQSVLKQVQNFLTNAHNDNGIAQLHHENGNRDEAISMYTSAAHHIAQAAKRLMTVHTGKNLDKATARGIDKQRDDFVRQYTEAVNNREGL